MHNAVIIYKMFVETTEVIIKEALSSRLIINMMSNPPMQSFNYWQEGVTKKSTEVFNNDGVS